MQTMQDVNWTGRVRQQSSDYEAATPPPVAKKQRTTKPKKSASPMMPEPIVVVPVSQMQSDHVVTVAAKETEKKATNVKVIDKLVASEAKVSTIPAPSRVIPFPVDPPPRPKGVVIRDPIESTNSGLTSKFSTASTKNK